MTTKCGQRQPRDPGGASFLFNRLALCCLIALVGGRTATAQPIPPSAFTKLSFDQKLGTQVNLGLRFRDETGASVSLGDYFGGRPVILDLGYYKCPMLCTLVLNGLVQSLQGMESSAGRDFNVVCVSISPTEGPELAAAKRRSYLKLYNRPGAEAGWHFLTGQETSIRRLVDEIGFHYAYDPSIQQFAHPSGIVVITPEGRVSRYFFGVTFPSAELKEALSQAQAERAGARARQLLILCFEHLPLIGKYSGSVMAAVRIAAGLVLLGMAAGFALMARRNPKFQALGANPGKEAKQP